MYQVIGLIGEHLKHFILSIATHIEKEREKHYLYRKRSKETFMNLQSSYMKGMFRV